MIFSRRVFRTIAWVVLVSFSSLSVQHVVAALQFSRGSSRIAAGQSADEQHARIVAEIQRQADVAKANRALLLSSETQAQEIQRLDTRLQSNFVEIDKELSSMAQMAGRYGLDAQYQSVAVQAQVRRHQFQSILNEIAKANLSGSEAERDASLSKLSAYFDLTQRPRHDFDPKSLAWRTPKREVRRAIEDPQKFPIAIGDRAIKRGSANLAKSLTSPLQSDVVETVDVQLTAAIRAKAMELGGSPIAIFNYVRNHIEYFPSYGSVQGSDATLAQGRGNAFDISSLLIALLRASAIPARYSYGTVELSSEQASNWVGGTATGEAALEVLAQGGIPSSPVISGGKVTAVRLEHIWVEAWIPFFPSRGGSQSASLGYAWVPLDASIKQYAYSQGMNIQSNQAFDAAAFESDALRGGATFNPSEGWIQGLSQATTDADLTRYKAQVAEFVSGQSSSPTIAAVNGTRAIVATNHPILEATLPAKLVAQGPRYSDLPDALRHKFQYAVYATASDRDLGSPIITFSQSLPQLAGKKIVLSFSPSTPSDAQAMEGLLPNSHADGTPIQPAEFPTTIPATANVTANLLVDGQVVASNGPLRLGQQLAGRGGFTEYDFSGFDLSDDDTLIAGQPTAIGLSVQGIIPSQLDALRSRLDSLNGALTTGSIASLNADTTVGDFLTAPIWGYFGSLQSQGRLAATQASMIDLPALSYGLVHAAVRPNKLFGTVTTSISFVGLLMDVGHLRHLRWSKANDTQAWISYNRMRGAFASALEYAVPEQLFVDPSTCNSGTTPSLPACLEAVSAVKAIAVAGAAGQKLYQITQSNVQSIDGLSLSSSVADDIRSAAAAGMEIVVHEHPVTIGSWTGTGYVITDPTTGAGAYLIEGSANGGFIALTFLAILLALIMPFIVFYIAGAGAAIVAAFFAGLNVKGMLKAIEKYVFDQDNLSQDQKDARLGFLSLASILSSILAIFGARNASPADKMEGWFITLLSQIPNQLAKLFNNI